MTEHNAGTPEQDWLDDLGTKLTEVWPEMFGDSPDAQQARRFYEYIVVIFTYTFIVRLAWKVALGPLVAVIRHVIKPGSGWRTRGKPKVTVSLEQVLVSARSGDLGPAYERKGQLRELGWWLDRTAPEGLLGRTAAQKAAEVSRDAERWRDVERDVDDAVREQRERLQAATAAQMAKAANSIAERGEATARALKNWTIVLAGSTVVLAVATIVLVFATARVG